MAFLIFILFHISGLLLLEISIFLLCLFFQDRSFLRKLSVSRSDYRFPSGLIQNLDHTLIPGFTVSDWNYLLIWLFLSLDFRFFKVRKMSYCHWSSNNWSSILNILKHWALHLHYWAEFTTSSMIYLILSAKEALCR